MIGPRDLSLAFSLMALAALLPACGQGSRSNDPGPESDAPTGETAPDDAARAAEYEALPPVVLLGVDLDENGRDVEGTGELRIPAAAADVSSDEAALATFEASRQAKTVLTVDELDRDTSTQSWTPATAADDYATFMPQVYSQVSRGATYTYGEGTRYQYGNKAVYAYPRPPCYAPYCRPGGDAGKPGPAAGADLDRQLADALQRHGVKALGRDEWYGGSREAVELGGRLFNDPILSAGGDIACSSCHADQFGTGSNYSVSPSGPVQSGRKRAPFVIGDLLARNAPPVFNLGHKSFDAMFWDARVARDPSQPSGFRSPAGAALPRGLDNALAAQALFPLIASNEMGCSGSAGMHSRLTASPTEAWDIIIKRVLQRADYRAMFKAAYPTVAQPTIAHLANAIAAYESQRWRADDSPFDRYLRGDKRALTTGQKTGALYFYGKALCASCHAGALQTDHKPHAIAIPQWGPGTGDGAGNEDYGVARVTGRTSDRYKFRTPTLRNVELTGPWGHNGAYRSLRQFVMHYTDTARAHDRWQPSQIVLPPGFPPQREFLGAWNDPAARAAVKAASQVQPTALTPEEIDLVVEFLVALTDDRVARNSKALIINP